MTYCNMTKYVMLSNDMTGHDIYLVLSTFRIERVDIRQVQRPRAHGTSFLSRGVFGRWSLVFGLPQLRFPPAPSTISFRNQGYAPQTQLLYTPQSVRISCWGIFEESDKYYSHRHTGPNIARM